MAPADDVPASGAVHESIGIELALGLRFAARVIGHAHAPMFLRGGAQQSQYLLVDHRHRPGEFERNTFIDGAQPLLELDREHALQLVAGAGDRGHGLREAQAARGHQAHRQRQRFLIRENHRWQLEAGHHLVAAVTALGGHDGNSQLLERHDVAPQRTAVDFELARQLGAAGDFPRLQQLQQCQHPGGGLGHGQVSRRIRAGIVLDQR